MLNDSKWITACINSEEHRREKASSSGFSSALFLWILLCSPSSGFSSALFLWILLCSLPLDSPLLSSSALFLWILLCSLPCDYYRGVMN
jgi:hypothetical protein